MCRLLGLEGEVEAGGDSNVLMGKHRVVWGKESSAAATAPLVAEAASRVEWSHLNSFPAGGTLLFTRREMGKVAGRLRECKHTGRNTILALPVGSHHTNLPAKISK